MDKEILTAAEVAKLLDLDLEVVAHLFEDGSLPGRRIADQWYVSRRQLVEFIEQGALPVRSGATVKPMPPYFRPKVDVSDNSWECSACGRRNPVERVICVVCKSPRMVPLMSYRPH